MKIDAIPSHYDLISWNDCGRICNARTFDLASREIYCDIQVGPDSEFVCSMNMITPLRLAEFP